MSPASSPPLYPRPADARHWVWAYAGLLLLALWPGSAVLAVQPPRIMVIYPEAKGGYAILFEQIISGIEETTKGIIIPLAVPSKPDLEALQQSIEHQPIDVVIALGRRGIETAKALQPKAPVIAGGLMSLSEADMETYPAISLLPQPSLLFRRLHELAPDIQRVYLVYNPTRHDWLLPRARAAAKQEGLTLIARPATNIRSAARLYRELVGEMKSGQDALWLLQDSTLTGDTSLLSYLLQEAWQRRLLIFSSSPAHVRRGALFSLYADKQGLGRDLGHFALRIVHKGVKPGLRPTSEVNIAVNLRTASHLGLRISYQQQRQFNLVFPRP